MNRPMLFEFDTLQRCLAFVLWSLRALWGSMLLSPMVLYACATWVTESFADTIAKGATWIAWVDRPPWDLWLFAATVAAGSMLVPSAIVRRSSARLQGRISYGVDPSRPGLYRKSPGMVPECSDALIRAAAAHYAARLALSFAMLGSVVLVCIGGFGNPLRASGLAFSCRYYWRPVDYLPAVALASLLVAVQFPTKRRMLSILNNHARTSA